MGYDYNVRIEGDNLILSFDDRFIGVNSITAKVYNSELTKHDNSGHVPLGLGEKL